MAKTKDPLFLKWRSTHGGITGVQSRSGDVARSHFSPRRRRKFERQRFTPRQSQIVLQWRSISQAQRDAWNQFGLDNPTNDKYGDAYFRSGFDWFCAFGSKMNYFLNVLPTDPPPTPVPSYTPTLWVDFSAIPYHLSLYATPQPSIDEYAIVLRKLNCPTSTVSLPKPLFAYELFPWTSFPNPIVTYPSEIESGVHAHFFQILAMDSFGRSPAVQSTRMVFSW